MVQKNSLEKFAIVICGPTGSGKSDLAINLAQILSTEIISADSIAIYKKLNIGTAKPTESEQKLVKHHMIDVYNPDEVVTVSDYESQASKILNAIFENGKIPIICGGTGFYINSLLYDLSYGNCGKNQKIREKYERLLKENGAKYLHSLLVKCDKETADKLHYNDTVRVIRALEIFESSGVKKSEIVDERTPKFKFFAFSYDYPREKLYERINLRVDKMFDLGLVDEVKSLVESGLSLSNQSMQGIGYKEFFEFDNIDENILKIKDNIKQNSRRYAKRQITFFKKLDGIHYLEKTNIKDEINEIMWTIKNEINGFTN